MVLAAFAILAGKYWASHRARTSSRTIEWVDPKQLQPGPIRHNELSPEQTNKIQSLQKIFAEVDPSPVEKWFDDFKRDAHPDRELAIWQRIAFAYTNFCAPRNLSLEQRKEIYGILIVRSGAPPKETFAHIELKTLTKEQAEELVNSYR